MSADQIWESSMRRSLLKDNRYKDPEALRKRIAYLRQQRSKATTPRERVMDRRLELSMMDTLSEAEIMELADLNARIDHVVLVDGRRWVYPKGQ